jgi:hypothetical protein
MIVHGLFFGGGGSRPYGAADAGYGITEVG